MYDWYWIYVCQKNPTSTIKIVRSSYKEKNSNISFKKN